MNVSNCLRSPMFRQVNGWPGLRLVPSKSENPGDQTEAFKLQSGETMPPKRSPKQTAVKVDVVPSTTTADDIATINAIRKVCIESLVGRKPSPIAQAYFEAVLAVCHETLQGVAVEQESRATQRAYMPAVLEMLCNVRQAALNIQPIRDSEPENSRRRRVIETIEAAKRKHDNDIPLNMIVPLIVAEEFNLPDGVRATAKAWTETIEQWTPITTRSAGNPWKHWSVLLLSLLEPDTPRSEVIKRAQILRQNLKSRQ